MTDDTKKGETPLDATLDVAPDASSNSLQLGENQTSVIVPARLGDLSRERRKNRREKRDRYFIKGPLPFPWVRENIPNPTSRLILVAKAFMDMERRNEVALSRKIWDCAGIPGSSQRRHVLERIRTSVSGYRVIPRRGRTSLLKAVFAGE